MIKLSNLSKELMFGIGAKIFMFLSIIPVILLPLITYLYVQYKVSNLPHWKQIKIPLVCSLIPLVLIWYIWFGQFMQMAGGSINYIGLLLKTVSILLISILILSFITHRRKIFSIGLIKSFVQGFLLALLICVGMPVCWKFVSESILRRDPAYLELLQQIEARGAVGKFDQSDSQNG